MKAGDVLSIRLPGSGGYGSPIERSPESVRWDVINGKISIESALKNYKVVFDEDMKIDYEATNNLRTEQGAEKS